MSDYLSSQWSQTLKDSLRYKAQYYLVTLYCVGLPIKNNNVFHQNFCEEIKINLIIDFSNLRTVPTNSKVFLRGLLTMPEKQILTSVI